MVGHIFLFIYPDISVVSGKQKKFCRKLDKLKQFVKAEILVDVIL